MSPLKWFRCPDKTITPVEQCLARCSHRCLTLPTLKYIASERLWNGHPSTTQLLNGTILEFLKITRDYTVDPQDRAFALLGTRHHQKLELEAKEMGMLAEIALSPDGRDVFDLLEPSGDEWLLTDYKSWGSYRVARSLGIVARKVPDPTGAAYKTSGKWGKAGSPKMVNVFTIDSNTIDIEETTLQLNRYRVMLEDRGLKINNMQVQVTVRDGGLQAATNRGIDFNIKLIPIEELDDGYIKQWFDRKEKALLLALEIYYNHDKTFLPLPCNDKECWNGRRCQDYCEVVQFCSKGMLYQKEG